MGNDSSRYPFKVTVGSSRAEVNRRVNDILNSVIPLIRQKIAHMCGGRIPDHNHDDVYAACLEQLWNRDLANYDTEHSTKPSTYIFSCVNICILDQIRFYIRKNRSKKNIALMAKGDLDNIACRDESSDRAVEAAANHINANLSDYFHPKMIEAMQAKFKYPGMAVKDLAKLLGYKSPDYLSRIFQRMRDIISDVSIEDYATGTIIKSSARRFADESISVTSYPPAGSRSGRARSFGGPGPETRATA